MSNVTRITENTDYYLLDVSSNDPARTNQISHELAKAIGTIKDYAGKQPYVEFKAILTGNKKTQQVAQSMSSNAVLYEIDYYPTKGVPSFFTMHDPFLKTQVPIGLVQAFEPDGGQVRAQLAKSRSIFFRKEEKCTIRLYAGQIEHERMFQLMMLHPHNKDNVARRLQIEKNLSTGIQVAPNKFVFYLEESQEAKELRDYNNNMLRERVTKAVSDLNANKAFNVLRAILSAPEVNTENQFDTVNMSDYQVYNTLSNLVYRRADSIDMVMGQPRVLGWRTAYHLYQTGAYVHKHGVLSYNGITVSPAVSDEALMTTIYQHVMDNDITAEDLTTPNEPVDSFSMFPNEQQKNKGGRPRKPITE